MVRLNCKFNVRNCIGEHNIRLQFYLDCSVLYYTEVIPILMSVVLLLMVRYRLVWYQYKYIGTQGPHDVTTES